MKSRCQKTLKDVVTCSGIGIHYGKASTITLKPAPINTGKVFQKINKETNKVINIPANLNYVLDTCRSTTIGIDSEKISTIEHLMAALSAYELDNVFIEIDSEELPIGDGSALSFVELIERAGIIEQKAFIEPYKVNQPVFFEHNKSFLAAFPSDEFRISYTLHYPHQKTIGTQYHSIIVNQDSFKNEVANCRTFAIYEELCFLLDQGLIKGGCLENALVFKGNCVISQDGLRFFNEPVRHKILDLIGDLALIQKPILAHIVAIGSGHYSNVCLGKKILTTIFS